MTRFHRRFRQLLSLQVLLVATLVASVGFATTVLYLDLATLIERSDIVVRGKVIDQEYRFDKKRNNVMTHYTIEVSETYMGKPSPKVKFVQWGGMWDGMMSRIPGDAKFESGEDTILFLNEHEGVNYLTALGQSKYTVRNASGKSTVERDLRDIGFFQDSDANLPRVNHGGIERVELASFKAELESLISAIKGGQQ